MSTFVRLIPLLLVVIALFAIYQLIVAVMLALKGEWAFAAIYLLMTFAGFALARTLWASRQKAARAPE